MFVDNQSAIKLAENLSFHRHSKHIDVRYHFTRDLIQSKILTVNYVPTEQQKADVFTKPLLKTKHHKMVTLLGIQKKPNTQQSVSSSFFSTILHFLSILMMLFTLAAPAYCSNIKTQPVLWRSTKTPITSGHNEVHLVIQFVNPCDLLSADVIHKDVLEYSRTKCTEYYDTLFLEPLNAMCPSFTRTDVAQREPRFVVSLLIGVLVIAIISAVSLSATSLAFTLGNRNSIQALTAELSQQQARLELEAENMKKVESAVNLLPRKFASLLQKTRSSSSMTTWSSKENPWIAVSSSRSSSPAFSTRNPCSKKPNASGTLEKSTLLLLITLTQHCHVESLALYSLLAQTAVP